MQTPSFVSEKLRHIVRIPRSSTAVVLAVGMLFAVAPGQAVAKPRSSASPQRVCETAYQDAKERIQSARLLEAKELLGKCVTGECGSFLERECTALYTQLDRDVPSVVPIVTDEAGAPIALVEVRMDGNLLLSKIDGLSVPVDPGKHEFSFSTDTGVFATKKVMIAQGERNRPILVLIRSSRDKGHGAAMAAAHKGSAPKLVQYKVVSSPAIAQSEATAPKERSKNGLRAGHGARNYE